MDLEALRAYCLGLPLATEEMPFGEDFWVCKVGGKIFLIANLAQGGRSISLKCQPDYALELRDRYAGSILPGYHLNKRHWNTLHTDQLPQTLVEHLIRHSWNQVTAGLSRRRRTELGLTPLPE